MSHQDSSTANAGSGSGRAAASPEPAETADLRAAAAVVAHHAQLAAALHRHTERVLEAAERADMRDVWRARAELVSWLHGELLPHATAEEAVLYPAAAVTEQGKLLVDGMLDEHRTILRLVDELGGAGTPVRASAAARALAAVFDTHLAKENDLVVPLVLASGEVSLAELLDGMHDLLGGGHQHDLLGGGHQHGHDSGQGAGERGTEPAAGGCGGGCGCGGDSAGQAGAGAAEAPVLTIDPRLDVRDVPHDRRHATVLAALEAVPAGGALVLVAPHAPRPLLAEIGARYPGQFEPEWLQEGPSVWQIRLQRAPALA